MSTPAFTVEDQLAVLAAQMEVEQHCWREGLEDTPRKRAFALGKMLGLQTAAHRLQPGQTVVALPYFWQSHCDRLGV